MLIFLLLFLQLVLSTSSTTQDAVVINDTPKTTKVHHQTTNAPTPSLHNDDDMAKRLTDACFGHNRQSDSWKTFDSYIHGCSRSKDQHNKTALEYQWNFCCRLRQKCHDGPSSDHKCSDIFCDCLDLVNLANAPSTAGCQINTDRMNGICGEDMDSFPDRYVNIYENVGFGAIYGKNLVFGTSGWITMSIILTIFLGATAYLIISYIQFKCNKVTKEVIATKEAETRDEYYQAAPPPQATRTKKFHDKVVLKA